VCAVGSPVQKISAKILFAQKAQKMRKKHLQNIVIGTKNTFFLRRICVEF